MSTSQNYSGRKVDLSLFPELKTPSVLATMTVAGPGRVIAGPAKAAQNFLFALLGREGERPGDPDFGTQFLARLTQGSVRYPSDVDQIFTLEASKAVDWWNSKSKLRPLDEQIKGVSLTNQSVDQSKILLSVSLTTRGDGSTAFLIPVNWSN